MVRGPTRGWSLTSGALFTTHLSKVINSLWLEHTPAALPCGPQHPTLLEQPPLMEGHPRIELAQLG